jgi:hypothetical protein
MSGATELAPTEAIVWRRPGGRLHTGSLEILSSALVLHGADLDGRLVHVEVPYERLSGVRIGRSSDDRINGSRALVLEREGEGEPALHVSTLEGSGAVFDLGDLIATLAARASGNGSSTSVRIAVVLPLRAGAHERARELVADGPPFELGDAPFERHDVFLTDREAVFVFEGRDVARAVQALARTPAVWRAAAAWRRCLRGRPRVGEAVYSWSRPIRGVGAPHSSV